MIRLILLPLLTLVFSTLAFRNVFKISKSRLAASRLRVASHLAEYYQSNFVTQDSSAKSFTYRIKDAEDMSWIDEYSDIIVLADLGVRSISQIKSYLEKTNLQKSTERFFSKSVQKKDNFFEEKFLYTYDIGIDTVTKMSVARIPLSSYNRLDLASRLAAIHLESPQTIVLMINQDSEIYADNSMADALLSAFQMHSFTMPKFTKVQTGQTPLQPKSNTVLTFTQPTSTVINDETNIEPKKMSLEEAMLRASERNYGVVNEVIKETPQNVPPPSLADTLKKSTIINAGTNLARSLSSLPPNILNPTTYLDLITNLTKGHNLSMEVYRYSVLKILGCGAFCAVIQGNQLPDKQSDDALVKLSYTPSNVKNKLLFRSSSEPVRYRQDDIRIPINDKKPLVLVGKGVCYDTGGWNLKPGKYMKTMKHDMTGSAVALALFKALVEQDVPYPVECWLAIAENNLDKNSYRPDDVVRAVTGDTIEVVDTDAEGRMLLADTLALASRHPGCSANSADDKLFFDSDIKPALVLDFATLTGACVSSLTSRYIGAMTNRETFVSHIIKAGKVSGERLWPFPVDDDLGDDLKSDVADILQCRQSGEGDHLHAAYFLKKFVHPTVPWVHFDLSSAYRQGGLGHVPTDYTGSGVRVAHALLEQLLDFE